MDDKLRHIENGIKFVLISCLEIDPDRVRRSSLRTPLLGRGIGLDSVETLKLVAGLEEGFGIYIDDFDLTVNLFKDIGTLAEYVAHKIGKLDEYSERGVAEDENPADHVESCCSKR